jgi:hypothetical protein
MMTMSSEDQECHVECWMRKSVSTPIRRRQMSVEEQLKAQVTNGILDSVTVRTWDRAVYQPAEGQEKRTVDEKVIEFEQWAVEHGYDLQPGFTQRQHSRSEAIEEGLLTEILLPILCIAVYNGPRLRVIAPFSDTTQNYTVCDLLAALEKGEGFLRPPFSKTVESMCK